MGKGISVDAKIERHVVLVFLSAAYVRQQAHLDAVPVEPDRIVMKALPDPQPAFFQSILFYVISLFLHILPHMIFLPIYSNGLHISTRRGVVCHA